MRFHFCCFQDAGGVRGLGIYSGSAPVPAEAGTGVGGGGEGGGGGGGGGDGPYWVASMYVQGEGSTFTTGRLWD